MFCSSVRKRREWSEIPNLLLRARFPRWKETANAAFDIALPFQMTSCDRDSLDLFRFILLSHRDLETPTDKISRAQRLFHVYGGSNVGIIFLLNEQVPVEDGSEPLMTLQASLLPEYVMPIIPLYNIDSFEETLSSFQQQMCKPAPPNYEDLSIISLLPFCSVNPPIPEHARYILSDICLNIPGLQALVSTPEGLQKLSYYLSDYPQVVQDIISFWHIDSVMD